VPSEFAQHCPLDPAAMPGVQRPVAINTLLRPLALLHAYCCTTDSVLMHTMVSFAMHVTLLAARTSIILLAACSNMMQPLMNKHAGNTTDEATACLSVHCMGGNTQEIHFCRSALRSHFCVRSGALTSNVRSGDRMALYIEVTSNRSHFCSSKSLLMFEIGLLP